MFSYVVLSCDYPKYGHGFMKARVPTIERAYRFIITYDCSRNSY